MLNASYEFYPPCLFFLYFMADYNIYVHTIFIAFIHRYICLSTYNIMAGTLAVLFTMITSAPRTVPDTQ